VVAGPQYPAAIEWPANVERVEHLPPAEHRAFYNRQAFTLNVTRADMIRAGYSPSVRLFEAAACGVPIISDSWAGLETLFTPGVEIVVASDTGDVVDALRHTTAPERERMARLARARILKSHTAAHRAAELEGYVTEALQKK
jgi:spore maturation protein CgeB